MKKLFFIFTLFLCLWFYQQIHACSCVYWDDEDLQNKISRSDGVFLWEVVGESLGYKKSYIDTRINKWRSEKSPIIHFEVDASWKWVSQSKVQVFSRKWEASCWYNFKTWKKYLVFVHWDEIYSTGLCSGNKEVSIISNDVILLDEMRDRKELVQISQFEEHKNYMLAFRYYFQIMLFYVRELWLLIFWIIVLIVWIITFKKNKKNKLWK